MKLGYGLILRDAARAAPQDEERSLFSVMAGLALGHFVCLLDVVPANAGTHTAESPCGARWQTFIASNVGLRIWVPDRARYTRLSGTTKQFSFADT